MTRSEFLKATLSAAGERSGGSLVCVGRLGALTKAQARCNHCFVKGGNSKVVDKSDSRNIFEVDWIGFGGYLDMQVREQLNGYWMVVTVSK